LLGALHILAVIKAVVVIVCVYCVTVCCILAK